MCGRFLSGSLISAGYHSPVWIAIGSVMLVISPFILLLDRVSGNSGNIQLKTALAEVAEQLCFGSPRLTETEFNFGRHTIELGMHEKRTGLVCYGNYASQGKPKAEVANPQLEQDIRSLVDPESQADPQLRNTFSYARITASAVREKLIDEKGWQEEQLPKERTFCNMLNRMGYKLHKVQKTTPEKNPGKKSRKPMPSLKTSNK